MSSPKMKVFEENTPPLTNSNQMLRKECEGDGEGKTIKPESALEKIVASDRFGLSRVRCAGWRCDNLFA